MVDDIAAMAKCGSDSVEVNAIINAKIKSKFLELGAEKCVCLHVGKKKQSCSTLLAQESKMEKVSEVTYLGNIISEDGSNEKNILDRWNKGLGITSSVISLLKHISLGVHYFKIGLILRETNVINGILNVVY